MSKPILVVGSAALDSVESPAGKVDDALGGSSFFFSTAASIMSPVRLVAVVGTDFPHEEIRFLEQREVDLRGLEKREGATFRWGGKYHDDPNKRDTLFTELGVFESFEPVIPDHFRDSPIVFLGNIHPQLQLDVLKQIEKPELIVLDTMNYWIHGTHDLLMEAISKIDVLIVNDEEAFDLTGEHDILTAVEALFRFGPSSVVLKKGQHGSMLARENGDVFFLPAYPTRKVKDPTGAGDTFAGGFLGYLAAHNLENGHDWRLALGYGTIIASFLVEDFSMERTKNLTLEQVDERMAEFRTMTQF